MKYTVIWMFLIGFHFDCLGQEYLRNKAQPWIVKAEKKYTGNYISYEVDFDEAVAFRVIIEDNLVVVQSQTWAVFEDSDAPLNDQPTGWEYINFPNAELNGHKLTFGQSTRDFVKIEEGDEVMYGFFQGETFQKKQDYHISQLYPGRTSWTSYTRLSLSELAMLSLEDLKIMHYEIYARYGYIFEEGGDMDAYFQEKEWYKSQPGEIEKQLTILEKENISQIREMEDLIKRGEIPVVKPSIIGDKFQFSDQAQQELDKIWAEGEVIIKKIKNQELTRETLNDKQEGVMGMTFETPDPIRRSVYEIRDPNPFWDGFYQLEASSTLPSSKPGAYHVKNLMDLNLRTGWVEGHEDQGIGESITYYKENASGVLKGILIYNGYSKSDKLWAENSRVKTLKFLINEFEFFQIELEDTNLPQSIPMSLDLGSFFGSRMEFPGDDPVRIRFEILDVYPGSKYKDTIISELHLVGDP